MMKKTIAITLCQTFCAIVGVAQNCSILVHPVVYSFSSETAIGGITITTGTVTDDYTQVAFILGNIYLWPQQGSDELGEEKIIHEQDDIDGNTYDLQGRRVTELHRNQLYIHNRKKIIVGGVIRI